MGKPIPKIIHYCWFGGNPLPELAIRCLNSWKKYCPDYEIKQWDESNFDIGCCAYVREAYNEKKWAFVSDYARFWILYHYGGVYFDTDVEVIKPIDELVNRGSFMGKEKAANKNSANLTIAPGLGLAANPGLGIYKEILDYYKTQHFLNADGDQNLKTVVTRVTELLEKYGYQGNNGIEVVKDIYIYPPDYLCPKDYDTGKLVITPNTYSIHHYTASWHTKEEERIYFIYKWLNTILGQSVGKVLTRPLYIGLAIHRKIAKYGLLKTFELCREKIKTKI